MFGFVKPYLADLSQEEKDRYNAVYCGLCRVLNDRFGILGRLGLNNDMTFLVLLVQSLYEPEETLSMNRCPPHPTKKHLESQSLYTQYAADMTVALFYHKALDDWEDEKKAKSRAYAALLEKHYQTVKERHAAQCEAIESCIQGIREVEANPGAHAESAANLSGKMLEAVFHINDDVFTDDMKKMGFGLGKFIYVMDAAVDFEKDERTGCYNSLKQMEILPQDAQSIIRIPLGTAAEGFESLPLEKDLHLMRNILYSGVWQEYNKMINKAGNKHGD